MIKKQIVLLIVLIISFFFNKKLIAEVEVKVIAIVNDEIITNHDVKKESNYIEILNPGFSQLGENQRFNISKNYLIDQIIKEKEVKRFINLEKNNEIIDEYLKNLYTKLNFESEFEFKKLLNSKDNYSLAEIRDKINIELYWNDLIYSRYINQIKIDKEQILKKINELKNTKYKEYLLSEIAFTKKRNLSVKKLYNEIKISIEEIGFDNTANIYSQSDSAKFGGKLGWVSEISLSKNIKEELKKKKKDEYTDLIELGNIFLILKIKDIKIKNIDIDEGDELRKMIQSETNSQLSKFSKIYFDKIKLNYLINEK